MKGGERVDEGREGGEREMKGEREEERVALVRVYMLCAY